MGKVCAVVGCKSKSGMKEVSFHRFPRVYLNSSRVHEKYKELECKRLKAWLAALQINFSDESNDIFKTRRICSIHFVSGESFIVNYPQSKQPLMEFMEAAFGDLD